jgi:hypothetical protein
MRIENLIENNNHRQILRESCDGLTLEQRRIVEGIYNEFVPLIEATLTADQINRYSDLKISNSGRRRC